LQKLFGSVGTKACFAYLFMTNQSISLVDQMKVVWCHWVWLLLLLRAGCCDCFELVNLKGYILLMPTMDKLFRQQGDHP
jgi:hypothetical protein